MYLNPIRVQRRDKYIPDLRQGVGLHIRALRNGGETTFPDKLNYTSTALRSITTDSKLRAVLSCTNFEESRGCGRYLP